MTRAENSEAVKKPPSGNALGLHEVRPEDLKSLKYYGTVDKLCLRDPPSSPPLFCGFGETMFFALWEVLREYEV